MNDANLCPISSNVLLLYTSAEYLGPIGVRFIGCVILLPINYYITILVHQSLYYGSTTLKQNKQTKNASQKNRSTDGELICVLCEKFTR